MHIVSVFNNKGGVGKSTLTYHLGSALSDMGVKTLLVDLDPQSNLTLYGLTEEQLEDIWLSEDAFIDDFSAAKKQFGEKEFLEFQQKPHSIHYLLKPVEDGESDEEILSEPIALSKNLGLIPGRLTLHMFESKISKQWSEAFLGEPQAIRTVTAIRKKCEEYAEKYGYQVVLIDTSPSLSALNKVIISTSDSFIIPCAPDMFSDYGIRNIGNALGIWKREFETMYSLLSDSKRVSFPKYFVKLLGYTIYNAKKRSDASNALKVAKAHANHAEKLPHTIIKFIPPSCYDYLGKGVIEKAIGDNSLIHSHNTLPTVSQKYKLPMWEVPDCPNLDDDKSTISGNKSDYYDTKEKYITFAKDVLNRLGALK